MIGDFEYGCVLLHLNMPYWFETITNFNANDLYFEQLSSGICMEPHVTILYGLHNDVSVEDIDKIVRTIDKKKIDISFGEVDYFSNEGYDVVKIPVVSKYLTELNAKFKELPYTSNFPDYKPHVTLAYVQSGLGEKYKSIIIDHLYEVGDIEYSNIDIIKKY